MLSAASRCTIRSCRRPCCRNGGLQVPPMPCAAISIVSPSAVPSSTCSRRWRPGLGPFRPQPPTSTPASAASSLGAASPGGWKDLAAHLAEPDPVAVALAPAGDDDLVAILEKGARRPAAKRERPLPVPRQFEEAPPGVLAAAADGARAQQIAHLQVAAGDSMVRELLRHAPVQVAEIGAAERRRVAAPRPQAQRELDGEG